MDYQQHVETYQMFLRLTKYGIVFLVILLAGMKFFLV
ncbi:MAG: aa3-type cytochrome c oxidase subunit IV [Hyphomicrobium sp.]|nr:aa3-type cytochrome c oxidase subunit IV [Hyphomicrobium sp.]